MSESTENPRVVGDLAQQEFSSALAGQGLGVGIGPFAAHLRVDVAGLDEGLYRLYRDYPLLSRDRVFNFHCAIEERRRFGIVGKRLVRFTVDGRAPHEDFPAKQSLAILEWGINLVIALRSQRYIMLHAAVLERGGKTVVMPASPGDGKTTLCAGLAHRGWRLFSDEFGLIPPTRDVLIPMPRPMALKNESIGVIREFAPEAELGPVIPNTRKGTVAHVKPPSASVAAAGHGAPAGWIVFPRWVAGSPLSLEEIPPSEGFMFLASNAFNYELCGERAFISLRNIVAGARCFRLEYSNLEEAVEALSKLADD